MAHCVVCEGPIRKGLDGRYCGNVCCCKDNNITFGTKEYEAQRQFYLNLNQRLDQQKDDKYNQALLESGKLYIDHPEEVAHVEVKDGNVELKAPLVDALNDDGSVKDDWYTPGRLFSIPAVTSLFLKPGEWMLAPTKIHIDTEHLRSKL